VKKILLVLVFLVLWIWVAPLSAQEMKAQPESDYIIGPGDVLDISVWKDEALTKSVLVLTDGNISFPLIGVLTAAGKTVPDLKKEIEVKVKQYVTDPVVSVSVAQINSMIVYVIGRVNAPGKFALNANTTVLQALAMAGGLNPFAKRGDIKILRQEGGKTWVFPFDYDDVIEGRNLEQNILLKRGDVLVAP